MRALVIGTSNSIIKGGLNHALQRHFGVANVTNLSLGGSSGTFLALCRFIEGVDFARYDYVFLDSIVNEQWQLRSGKSAAHLRNVARVFYGALPPGPTYIFLGYCVQPCFHRADAVELFHRTFCMEAGVNFIPLRELLAEFGAAHGIAPKSFFLDPSHYQPAVVARLIARLMAVLQWLPKKTQPAAIGREFFFVQDLLPQAAARELYSTSLRKQEYGVFTRGMSIVPAQGCFLGFDFVSQNTEAFIEVHAETGHFSKALHFGEMYPWMKVAGFYSEVITGPLSSIRTAAATREGERVESTEGIARLAGPLSGEARLSNFFFATHPISRLAPLFRLEGALPAPGLLKVCEAMAGYMQTQSRLFLDLLAGRS